MRFGFRVSRFNLKIRHGGQVLKFEDLKIIHRLHKLTQKNLLRLSFILCLLSFVFCPLSFVFCLLSFVFRLCSFVFTLLILIFAVFVKNQHYVFACLSERN